MKNLSEFDLRADNGKAKGMCAQCCKETTKRSNMSPEKLAFEQAKFRNDNLTQEQIEKRNSFYRMKNMDSERQEKKRQNNKKSAQKRLVANMSLEKRQRERQLEKERKERHQAGMTSEEKKKKKDQRNKIARDKYNNDPEHKIHILISTAVRKQLKLRDGIKNGSSIEDFLPQSIAKIRAHIEEQFGAPENSIDGKVWMNWNNHGAYNKATWKKDDPSTFRWHIDHIISRADLPYKSMEEENFRKCWDMSNLRPLIATQNIIEGRRSRKK
jgi:hypothetical protein